jgi:hypothetical protein
MTIKVPRETNVYMIWPPVDTLHWRMENYRPHPVAATANVKASYRWPAAPSSMQPMTATTGTRCPVARQKEERPHASRGARRLLLSDRGARVARQLAINSAPAPGGQDVSG